MANRVADKDEEELNPAQERVVRRMRLLVGISTGIMVLGFLLVMSVIVWRLVKQDGGAAAPAGELQSVLPIGKGQRISGTTSDGERLFVTVEAEDGRQSIMVFDADTLAYRGKIESLVAP